MDSELPGPTERERPQAGVSTDSRQLNGTPTAPVTTIPGVDPADVWAAAAAEADAGKLTPHAEVFARLRARK